MYHITQQKAHQCRKLQLTLVHDTALHLHELHLGDGVRIFGRPSMKAGTFDHSTIDIYDSDQVVPSIAAMSGWSDGDLDFECLIV